MFKKGDIVKFKRNPGDRSKKWYKCISYMITSVNKKNEKVWIVPLNFNRHFFWRVNSRCLIKVE